MHPKFALDAGLQAVNRVFEAVWRDAPINASDLPEERFVLLGASAQHIGFYLTGTFDQNFQSGVANAVANLREDIIGFLAAHPVRDHQMGDPEGRVRSDRRAQALRGKRLRPQFARDVGHDAHAIAFAVDEAGPVSHAGKSFNRAFYVPVCRLTALTDGTNQSASVAL